MRASEQLRWVRRAVPILSTYGTEETHETATVRSFTKSIEGPHQATHGHGEAASQHHHKEQQTLNHEVSTKPPPEG